VVICADDDRGNPKAQALVQQAAERFAAQGRAVGIAKPPVGKDFNDTLKAETAA
jgi:DNA primase